MWVWAKRDTEAPKFGGRFCVLGQYTVECSVEFEPSQSWVLTESVLGPESILHCLSCMKEEGYVGQGRIQVILCSLAIRSII